MTSCPPKTGTGDCQPLRRTLGARLLQGMRKVTTVALCGMAAITHAQNRLSEYDVKSAYLFNFGKFVRFASADEIGKRQSFDICLVGEDPFGHTLDELTANELLDGKPVRVVRLKTVTEARGCAIVYVSGSEGARVRADLDALRGQAVLTVSDSANFLEQGGMIQFITVQNHVRFAVNLDAVRSAQLTLSSELLRVAISVNGEPPTGEHP